MGCGGKKERRQRERYKGGGEKSTLSVVKQKTRKMYRQQNKSRGQEGGVYSTYYLTTEPIHAKEIPGGPVAAAAATGAALACG